MPSHAAVHHEFTGLEDARLAALEDPYRWSITDPNHPGYYLQANENEYLALYGARELFGQLAEMEPRKPRKKRNGKRTGR